MAARLRGVRSPDVAAVIGAFPSGPTRAEFLDAAAFHLHKLPERIARAVLGRKKTRPHGKLLSAAVEQVRRAFPEPVCIETGCIRDADEGSDSTLAIATALGGRGRFYTFELDPAHIAVCRSVCRELNDRISYVEGDSKVNLRRLREDGTLDVVHLAFFDSADDPDLILAEFRAVEDLFVPGSIAVVDDVALPGVKGKRLKPYLRRHPLWDARTVYAGRGMLVALRRAEAPPSDR